MQGGRHEPVCAARYLQLCPNQVAPPLQLLHAVWCRAATILEIRVGSETPRDPALVLRVVDGHQQLYDASRSEVAASDAPIRTHTSWLRHHLRVKVR